MMNRLLLRLDDACEYMNFENWERMERLLDKYDVKPLIGIIPSPEDPELMRYGQVQDAWEWLTARIHHDGWTPALHGFHHVYTTTDGGINPVHRRSEFAGLPYEEQLSMIREGERILHEHDIVPRVFFAPSHTFDRNTLRALKNGSDIRIVSDTPANKPYCLDGVTIVPQQSGRARKLPFHTVTYCYHPNTMKEQDFALLEAFLKENRFAEFPLEETTRSADLWDCALMKLYFLRRGHGNGKGG